LTVKSMLEQFQRELWARFSIPLTRLDSRGIERVRNCVPPGYNPFYYYDKTIVSIDTLKQTGEYRAYLERCRWDVVVVDECHNVAERNASQRNALAKLIASRCDSLIMLSATPHDGRRSSFASLIDMLDPTAIADPKTYGAEDVKSLFVRRFKKDVKDQIGKAFPERLVEQVEADATPEEERAFDVLARLQFKKLDKKRKDGDVLFRTTLEKALFSSPVACRETIKKRRAKLGKSQDDDAREDDAKLLELDAALEKITPEKFSRYKLLLRMLSPDGADSICWNRNDPLDRVVIFAERVATVDFLVENLRRDLKLKTGQVLKLDASSADVDVMEVVKKFGVETEPVRILVSTDVASEGVNLHYCCRRLIHFDSPWSLVTFQQRNGRVDRYGQERRPEIRYLTIASANPKINGDARVLKLLQEKDKEVCDSIGDPSEFTGLPDAESEELCVAQTLEKEGAEREQIEREMEEDFFGAIFGAQFEEESDEIAPQDADDNIDSIQTSAPTTFYKRDYEFLIDALEFVNSAARKGVWADEKLQYAEEPSSPLNGRCVKITPNAPLVARLKYFPKEILPENGVFYLCDSPERVQREYLKSVKSKKWPEVQYLWDPHPVVRYLSETVVAAFGRLKAPLIFLGGKLAPDETLFFLSGSVPNARGRTVVSLARGVLCKSGKVVESKPVEDWIERLGFLETMFNPRAKSNPNEQQFEKVEEPLKSELSKGLESAIDELRFQLEEQASARRSELLQIAKERKEKLNEWRRRKLRFLDELFDKKEFANVKESLSKKEKKAEEDRREVEEIFRDYEEWVDQEAKIEKEAANVRVLAAVKGESVP